MKSKALQDHMVTYLNPHDLKIFTKEVKEKIWTLQNSGVTDIAIDRNTLYLKQDLIDDNQVSLIGLLFGKKKTITNEKKEKIMQAMIDTLSDQNFLALFRENED